MTNVKSTTDLLKQWHPGQPFRQISISLFRTLHMNIKLKDNSCTLMATLGNQQSCHQSPKNRDDSDRQTSIIKKAINISYTYIPSIYILNTYIVVNNKPS